MLLSRIHDLMNASSQTPTVFVLVNSEPLAAKLGEQLSAWGLKPQRPLSQWQQLSGQLQSAAGPSLVLMSRATLCARNLEALLEADLFFLDRPSLQHIIIVEPHMSQELESVEMMTDFRNILLLDKLDDALDATLQQLFPGLSKSGGSGPEDALLGELEERLRLFSRVDAYEIFGLEPGCGSDQVRSKFYELVKKHHPDAYGRKLGPDAQETAGLIFIHVIHKVKIPI